MTVTVTLGWPSSDLSPNARGHWAIKARAAKAYRLACAFTAREAKIGKMDAPALSATITFHPPTRHARDRDNMIASFKAGQDGLVDVVKVDDANWVQDYRVGEVRKGGAVVVTLTPLPVGVAP